MKLAELVSALLKEDKDKHFSWKQGQNFVNIMCYQAYVVQHVCELKFVYFLLCGT